VTVRRIAPVITALLTFVVSVAASTCSSLADTDTAKLNTAQRTVKAAQTTKDASKPCDETTSKAVSNGRRSSLGPRCLLGLRHRRGGCRLLLGRLGPVRSNIPAHKAGEDAEAVSGPAAPIFGVIRTRTRVNERNGGDNRPKSLNHTLRICREKCIVLQSDFLWSGKVCGSRSRS